ncbi:hypothetical protein ACS386_10050 [Flavobacteriaceae bacterium LMO-SS05]
MKKEALINEHKALNDKAREEKFQKLTNRSNEIQDELQRLAEFKNEIEKKQNEEKEPFNVRLS